MAPLYNFLLKQASAAIFGIFLLFLMVVTKFYYPLSDVLHRYDFIFLCAIGFQLFLLVLKLEEKNEIVVILVFHIVATLMELFKTSDAIRAWHYPEEYLFGINNVPLFTGFMYSAVGSYLARVWRLFDISYRNYPRLEWTVLLVVLVYANFFTHHYLPDIRWLLVASSILLFYRTSVHSGSDSSGRGVPLLASWVVIAFLIWVAENISTYANIWLYPNQLAGWQMVSLGKLSSWYLLMLLSFVLISLIKFTHRSTIAENYLTFVAVGYTVFLTLVIINADMGDAHNLFAFVRDVPGRHHTAHIVLYGTLAVIANVIYRFRTVEIKGRPVLTASVLVFAFAMMEEVLQIWIHTRVFDYMDILTSFIGVVVFSFMAVQIRKRVAAS